MDAKFVRYIWPSSDQGAVGVGSSTTTTTTGRQSLADQPWRLSAKRGGKGDNFLRFDLAGNWTNNLPSTLWNLFSLCHYYHAVMLKTTQQRQCFQYRSLDATTVNEGESILLFKWCQSVILSWLLTVCNMYMQLGRKRGGGFLSINACCDSPPASSASSLGFALAANQKQKGIILSTSVFIMSQITGNIQHAYR